VDLEVVDLAVRASAKPSLRSNFWLASLRRRSFEPRSQLPKVPQLVQMIRMTSRSAMLAGSAVSGALRISSRGTASTVRSAYAPLLLTTPGSRHYSISPSRSNQQQPNLFGGLSFGGQAPGPSSFFQKPSLPANTIIRFVPQQTAWIVERMGKFNRILEPGLAILIPFLDRISYVKSLKESAIEIPSQSAITADNVTLELDGILYTRVLDAYKAR
jgi:SPFH domain / Band 7 family